MYDYIFHKFFIHKYSAFGDSLMANIDEAGLLCFLCGSVCLGHLAASAHSASVLPLLSSILASIQLHLYPIF